MTKSVATTREPAAEPQVPTGEANGLRLGVSQVFADDPDDVSAYVNAHFDRWDIKAPPGHEPQLRDLPPVTDQTDIPEVREGTHLAKKVEAHRECANRVLDHYFPLDDDETVEDVQLSYLSAPAAGCPAGSAAVLRRTNKAEVFFVDPRHQVDAEALDIVTPPSPLSPAAAMSAAPVDRGVPPEVAIVIGIYGAFAKAFLGPFGEVGVDLVNQALGLAGPQGPSWAEMQAMMRQALRDELITNDLEHVHAAYESVKEWSSVLYPGYQRAGMQKIELHTELSRQISTVSEQINLLKEPNHRLTGFGLLILGVDMYLSLLAEDVSLGFQDRQALQKVGNHWADEMLKMWGEVQKHRREQIEVTKFSYAVFAPPNDAITCYYWNWTDAKTAESHGSRNGPWQAGGKHDKSEAECRADAAVHTDKMIVDLTDEFGNPQEIAKSWRAVGTH